MGPVFEWMTANFPTSGSKIDWSRVGDHYHWRVAGASAEEIRAVVDEAFSKLPWEGQVIHAGDRQLEPGERMIYLDRKRNDARAPLKAVRLEAREVVVREATIMK